MTGRTIFSRYGTILNKFADCVGILPKNFRLFLLSCFRNTDGKFGILMRYILIKKLVKSCGDNVVVKPYVVLLCLENLEIGNNVSIHHFCYIDAEGSISIGNDCAIAHGTSILSSNHTWGDASLPIKYNPVEYSEVRIENDVWIGCGSRIMAGCHIGSRSVIAAGAVVTKNVESDTIFGGVPAKMIKHI